MRKGQITLFIMLGLVLLISILILIFTQRSLRPKADVGSVELAETLAKTCLVRTTENALAALEDDGLVLIEESGPLAPPGEDPYLVVTFNNDLEPLIPPDSWPRSVLGSYAFIGLCGKDPADPNGIGRFTDNRFTCANTIYQYVTKDYKGRDMPAVQLQLMTAIQQQMQECVQATGTATMIVQRDGLLVEWDNPAVQYTPRTPLHRAFKAAQYVVQKEVNTPSFSLNRIDNGMYPDRIIPCDECDGVTITYEGDPTANGVDTLLINASGEFVMRMQTADRGIAVKKATGDGFIDTLDLTDEFGNSVPVRITCEPHGDIILSDFSTNEEAIAKAKTCKKITYNSGDFVYTFDDDNLTLTISAASMSAWHDVASMYPEYCAYNDIGDVECDQARPEKFEKTSIGPEETRTYNPHENSLPISRHCIEDFTGSNAIHATISDGTFSVPALLEIPKMDRIDDGTNEVPCSV